ncbi:MAG: glycosyltransferase [Bacteroidales bacterium]|nr:glycosyltransferase [Bacteroidales bacterium]
MNKVLIITYYWPPSGGAGVQRWLKFTKYLREFGWEPVIFTPENPEPPAWDESLLADVPQGLQVIKRKIWEPYHLYKVFTGRKKEDHIKSGFLTESKGPGMAESLSVWIRGNLFIPDARKYWIKPSMKFLVPWLRENPVDLVATNGPPHSMHLIGLGIKKKLNLPWFADFRDPWTGIDFYDQLKLSSRADKKHKRLEKEVLLKADRITTVSWSWANDMEALCNRKIDVITNGFDEDDFTHLQKKAADGFVITHVGSMNRDRNPVAVWQVIADMVRENEDFRKLLKIRFIGFTDNAVGVSLQQSGLESFAQKIGYLPHKEVLEMASASSLLLLPLNNTPNVKGIIPGKIFEYLALKIPVFCIGDVNGDSARIIRSTGAGSISGFQDKAAMRKTLEDFFHKYKNGELAASSEGTGRYSRKKKTEELAGIFNEMIRHG